MGKCVHSAVINAAVDEVWQLLRNFHDMSWTKAIESLEPVGDARSDQVGALLAHQAQEKCRIARY